MNNLRLKKPRPQSAGYARFLHLLGGFGLNFFDLFQQLLLLLQGYSYLRVNFIGLYPLLKVLLLDLGLCVVLFYYHVHFLVLTQDLGLLQVLVLLGVEPLHLLLKQLFLLAED